MAEPEPPEPATRSLDTSGERRTVVGMDADTKIPEGCGGLWHAEGEHVNTPRVVELAARQAAHGLPQAVIMPGDKTVIIARDGTTVHP